MAERVDTDWACFLKAAITLRAFYCGILTFSGKICYSRYILMITGGDGMISKAYGAAVTGINSYIVTVEADVSSGLPQFGIVGLPDSSVREARERVVSALRNAGLNLSGKKITVNLAPGHIKKAGTLFDLPIAIAIMGAMQTIPELTEKCVFAGELSLDGKINAVKGVLPIVYEAKKAGFSSCAVPVQNAAEASLVNGIDIYPVKDLSETIEHLTGKRRIECIAGHVLPYAGEKAAMSDYADVKGQELVKRAFAIAAAGRHNIFVSGPPGVGKTMLASRLPSIMPPMTFAESVEATKVFSVRGLINEGMPLITERPFRAVHNTISRVALVGGGNPVMPGEISLAHTGVLFLDEFAEFPRNVLESLRQPMEERKINVTRAAEGSVAFPADFMLVAASNPCPCGHLGTDKCLCSDADISKYMSRISGPLLDRLDVQTELAPVEFEDLSSTEAATSSETLRQSVLAALEMQKERFKNEKILFNAQMEASHIKEYCVLGGRETKILESAYKELSLSARSYHRIIKLARTIADFEGAAEIDGRHLIEAIGYRNMDRRKWGNSLP